jgi:polyphosphate kinase
MEVYAIPRADLKDPPFQPVTDRDLVSADESPIDIFATLRRKDVLVHHPYESFTSSVQRFVEQAAADPDVLAIKQTLYRTSGESPIVDTLIEAAESGKQVVVLVEIKARFDEIANINWARTLSVRGAMSSMGVVGLVTHSKRAWWCEERGTACAGMFTSVPGTTTWLPRESTKTSDCLLATTFCRHRRFFNYLTGYSRQKTYRLAHRRAVRDEKPRNRDDRSGGCANSDSTPGRIGMKLNHLVDEAVIDALYEGVESRLQADLVAWHLRSSPGVAGAERDDPSAQHPGPVPGTLPRLLFPQQRR